MKFKSKVEQWEDTEFLRRGNKQCRNRFNGGCCVKSFDSGNKDADPIKKEQPEVVNN